MINDAKPDEYYLGLVPANIIWSQITWTDYRRGPEENDRVPLYVKKKEWHNRMGPIPPVVL